MIVASYKGGRYRVSRYLRVSNAKSKGLYKKDVSRDLQDVIVAKLQALGLKKQPWRDREAYDVHGLRTKLGVENIDLDER